MTTPEDVTSLTESSCWTLLRTASLGRLAVVSAAGRPDIYPVNFTTDHGTLVFRTDGGGKLDALRSAPMVAFEADGYDEAAAEVWSVVVHGRADPIHDTDDAVRTASLPLFPWQSGRKNVFVRVVPDAVSGRRFAVTAGERWRTMISNARPTPSE